MKPTEKTSITAKNNRLFKTLAVLTGVILSLVALEILFRTAGLIARRYQGSPNDAKGARYTVLCEGDSLTWGIGGKSYPAQLEAALNEGREPPLFKVINLGIPGQNSTQLLKHLENHLEEVRPDALIVCIGSNNSWSSSGPADGRSLSARADKVLLHSRVYKFLKLLRLKAPAAGRHDSSGIALAVRKPAAVARTSDDAEPKFDSAWTEKMFVESGRAYHAQGDFGRALACWQEGLRRRPRSSWLYLTLGQAHNERGEPDRALAYLRKGLPSAEPSDPFFLEMAGSYQRTGELDAALSHLKRVSSFSAASERLFVEIGQAYDARGHHDRALACWKGGLEKDGGSAWLRTALGKAYNARGEFDLALAYLEEGIARHPAESLYLEAARAATGKNKPADALAYLEKGLKLAPFSENLLIALGQTRNELGQRELAIAAWKFGLENNPGSDGLYLNLGIAYLRKGRLNDALAYLRKGHELNAASEQISVELARAYHLQGKFDEETAVLEKALKIHPAAEKILLELGQSYADRGKISQALALWEAGVPKRRESNPPHWTAAIRDGWKTDTKRALAYLKKNLEIYPRVEWLYVEMARLYHLENRDDQALLCLKRGLKTNPRSAMISEELARFSCSTLNSSAGRAAKELAEEFDLARSSVLALENDLRQIASIARSRRVKLILSSYPEHENEAARRVSGDFKAPYVDFIRLFKARFKTRAEYVCYDNSHCNTAGYAFMAEVFASAVKRALARAP